MLTPENLENFARECELNLSLDSRKASNLFDNRSWIGKDDDSFREVIKKVDMIKRCMAKIPMSKDEGNSPRSAMQIIIQEMSLVSIVKNIGGSKFASIHHKLTTHYSMSFAPYITAYIVSRRSGKTVSIAGLALALLMCLPGFGIMNLATTEDQAKILLNEIKMIIERNFKEGTEGLRFVLLEKSILVQHENGAISRIRTFPQNETVRNSSLFCRLICFCYFFEYQIPE